MRLSEPSGLAAARHCGRDATHAAVTQAVSSDGLRASWRTEEGYQGLGDSTAGGALMKPTPILQLIDRAGGLFRLSACSNRC